MNLTTLLKLASTRLDAKRGEVSTSDVAYAEINAEGRLVTVNPLAKMKWGWKEGASVQGEMQIALEGLAGSKPTELPLKLGGLHIGAIVREKNGGWMVFGYDPDRPETMPATAGRAKLPALDVRPSGDREAAAQTAKDDSRKRASSVRKTIVRDHERPHQKENPDERVQTALSTMRLLATTSADYAVFCGSALQTIAHALNADSVVLLVGSGDGRVTVGSGCWGADRMDEGRFDIEDTHPVLHHAEAHRSAVLINRVIAPGLCTRFRCEEAVLSAVYDQGQLTGYLLAALPEAAEYEEETVLRHTDQLVSTFETLYTWISMISRYRDIVSTGEDVIFSFRTDAHASRRYGFISDQVKKMTGFRPPEISGVSNPPYRWMEHVVHEADRSTLREKTAALVPGREEVIDYRIKHRNGSIRWVREHAVLTSDAIGVRNITGTLRDVSEIKAVETMVEEAREEAQEHRRSKTAFIATMSHEVRTPLGALSGYAQLLQKELQDYEQASGNRLPEQIHEFASVLTNRSNKLQNLVHDLFELSSLETGGAVLQKKRLPLHTIVRTAAAKVSSILHQKGVALVTDFCSADPVILGNEHCLEQVLDNVLSNATKFTEEGSVTVRTSTHGGEAVIEVEDTGIGISKDYQGELFEPFSQEENWRNRKFGGTGLGLALSRRLIDLLDGRIEVESEKGLGSTFRVVLPLAKD